MKRCCRCKIEKEVSEFGKRKDTNDGLQYMCKICLKQYFQSNKEKRNQCQKQYYQMNKEKKKQYYQLNREKKKEYQKQYVQMNKETIKEYQKQYVQLNKEKMRDYRNQYYRRNPEKDKARVKLNDAVQSGKIHKPLYCSSCDSDRHLEAHHTDYSKPLEVTWLCKSCHVDLHNRLRDKESTT